MQRVDLEYIAPEQIGRTTAFVDTRAGVTFFKMLTGTVPFVSEDRMEILHMHLAHVPPSVSSRRELKDTPLALDRIVAKLLEKGAKDRYESTFGMKCDLEKCWKLWRECESDQERSAIDFELATNDVQCFFKLPSKLYGRKKEIEILEAALQRVHSYAGEEKGLIELVMVEGSAGEWD
ncbi:serine/threonine kinase with two-component sensor domain [Jimgerdemannia flammicorona]|uniref:Serine/threonine kinase with two-component sensor domain n=1 Tax=Jimgerdemannia flammicorona TaxID=994334 RepID=A0A433PX47_9FUNG|nr:serine/threonine kinase with two-component sensor domain [Jimgerdemannia flammicorona]